MKMKSVFESQFCRSQFQLIKIETRKRTKIKIPCSLLKGEKYCIRSVKGLKNEGTAVIRTRFMQTNRSTRN